MSQNPFDNLTGGAGGLGGLDLGGLLQQAQRMQDDMQAAQQRLADARVDGSVAGGAVTVTLSGVGDLVAVTITPEALETSDPDALADALADLGDLVVAAFRDAKAKADEMASDTLGPIAGGLSGMLDPGQSSDPGQSGEPGQAPGKLGF